MINAYPELTAGVRLGGRLRLHLATDSPATKFFRAAFYRQGKNPAPEFIWRSNWEPVSRAQNGKPHRDWAWPFIDFEIPYNWRPGVYIVMLTEGDAKKKVLWEPDPSTSDGRSAKALFVVHGSHHRILYTIPILTYQAYNFTGGGSQYAWHTKTAGPLCKEETGHYSLLRPGGGTGNTLPGGKSIADPPPALEDKNVWDSHDQAQAWDYYDRTSPRNTFAHHDARFICWMEKRYGETIDYCTDLDIDGGFDLSPYRLVISAGHDEYWTSLDSHFPPGA